MSYMIKEALEGGGGQARVGSRCNRFWLEPKWYEYRNWHQASTGTSAHGYTASLTLTSTLIKSMHTFVPTTHVSSVQM